LARRRATVRLMRFLFGAGWWIPWHLAFYAVVLVCVVLTLVMFGQELKAPGQKPDTLSPGSILVFMIALGLAGLTLVNAALFSLTLAASWPMKTLAVVALTGIVLAVGLPLNYRLAAEQSPTCLYANVAYALIAIIGNLVLMWLARTHPRSSLLLLGGG
jgi:hypothetical protein